VARFLTANEVAERLGRNPYLVRRWLEHGRLKGEKFGPVWRVSDREVARFRVTEPRRVVRRSHRAARVTRA
jgi:excisionase family DNA binding protein